MKKKKLFLLINDIILIIENGQNRNGNVYVYTKAMSKTELRKTIVKLTDPAKLLAPLLIARYLPVTFVVIVDSASVTIAVEA